MNLVGIHATSAKALASYAPPELGSPLKLNEGTACLDYEGTAFHVRYEVEAGEAREVNDWNGGHPGTPTTYTVTEVAVNGEWFEAAQLFSPSWLDWAADEIAERN